MRVSAPFTTFIVIVTVIIYMMTERTALMLSVGPYEAALFYRTFSLTPALFFEGAWWQPLSFLFLHANFFHILANMLGIWSIGRVIETVMGGLSFIKLYLVSGLTSALAIIVLQHDTLTPTIGASGVVFGLLAALGIFFPNARLLVFVIPMRARTAVIVIAVLSVIFQIFDILPFVSHVGHLGGLVGGLLVTRLWMLRKQHEAFDNHQQPDFWTDMRQRSPFQTGPFNRRDDGGFYNGHPDTRQGGYGSHSTGGPSTSAGDDEDEIEIKKFDYYGPEQGEKEVVYNPQTGRFEVRDKQ